MVGDVEVHDASSSVREDYEAIQQSKGYRGHDEEVAGGGAIHVVLEERPPSLRWGTGSAADHVLGDRGFSNHVAK